MNKGRFMRQNIMQQLGYGLLYNWYAASDANFAPSGWHLPERNEIITLYTELGGSSIAGGKLKETGFIHWNTPNTGADNSSGFTAIGSGKRISIVDDFYHLKEYAYYHCYDLYDASSNYYFSFRYNEDDLSINNDDGKICGRSIRLIKDNSTDPGTLTDYDGNIYPTVKIGDQVWIAKNWKCKHLNNGTAIPEVTGDAAWAALTTGAWCYYNNDSRYM